MTDPLGLDMNQRLWSNIHAAFARRPMWWPPEVHTGRQPGEQCLTCGSVEHDPGCTALLAETLYDCGLRMNLALESDPTNPGSNP